MISLFEVLGKKQYQYTLSPEEGIEKLNKTFTDKNFYSYSNLMNAVNPWILKEFVQQFVETITVKNGTIPLVNLKDDISLHFY